MARAAITPRRRLASEQRREEILAAAAGVVVAQGFLPISIEEVGRAAGVSKALVYAYFPSQAALCNAMLMRAMAPLAERLAALENKSFEDFAVACAQLYFDQVATGGTLLHILFTDQGLDERRDRAAVALRDAVWRRLARAARNYAGLDIHERIGALAMIVSLPEETGRLAHRGELGADRARDLCARLVTSALHGLRVAAAS